MSRKPPGANDRNKGSHRKENSDRDRNHNVHPRLQFQNYSSAPSYSGNAHYRNQSNVGQKSSYYGNESTGLPELPSNTGVCTIEAFVANRCTMDVDVDVDEAAASKYVSTFPLIKQSFAANRCTTASHSLAVEDNIAASEAFSRLGSTNDRYSLDRPEPTSSSTTSECDAGVPRFAANDSVATPSMIKEEVDTYFGDITKTNWSSYEWEVLVISQLPDFARIYQVPNNTEYRLKESIAAMKEQLTHYLPPIFLEYDPTLWEDKLDAAQQTIEYLKQILHEKDLAEYNRKHADQQFTDDEDDQYVDPYLDDPMYGNSDSDHDPSDHPNSFYNKYVDDIKAFFAALPFNLVFNAGFHYTGVSTEDEQKCYCPCSWKMATWQTQFHLDGLCKGKGKKVDYCSDNRFIHHGLMSHLEKIGEQENARGFIHKGIHKYIHLLYKNFNNGLGHKALFKMADDNYKKIEIYEKKKMNDLILELTRKVTLEESKRLESDRIIKDMEKQLEQSGLQKLNEEKFHEMQKLSNYFRNLNLDLTPTTRRTAQELILYQQQLDSVFRAIRSCSTKAQNATLKLPLNFNLQREMNQWYKDPSKDVLGLFQDLNNKWDVSKFFAEWSIEFYSPELHGTGDRKKTRDEKKLEKETKAVDMGGPTAQFLNEFWKQLGFLTITVLVNGQDVKTSSLFEMTEGRGGLSPNTDDKISSHSNERVREQIWAVAAKWYRAIGRVMIHSIMGSKDEDSQKSFPIPSYVIPRFFRSSILSGCSCAEKEYYPWAQVTIDLNDIGLDKVFDSFIEDYGYDAALIFESAIPDYLIDERKIAISSLREGISVGGVLDFAGHLLKSIPIHFQRDFMFTKDQLDSMGQVSQSIRPYFKCMPLDVLDSLIFAKSCINLDDVVQILVVQFWEYSVNPSMYVPQEIVEHQMSLYRQIPMVLEECSRENEGFLSDFLEFFTGYSYLPNLSTVHDCATEIDEYPRPHPNANRKFELIVEFNGEEMSQNSNGDLPVAHTCSKTMRLPGTAYNGDGQLFKRKLLQTLSSMPKGYFDMK